jgi:phosphoribosylaminoimidazole-succinocarboxamide synthase
MDKITQAHIWLVEDASEDILVLLKNSPILGNPYSHDLSVNPFSRSKRERIINQIPHCITRTIHTGEKYQGKVRDVYIVENNQRVMISTDRLSAFDRNIAAIPFKGEVLNTLSAWWFEKTASLVPNHFIKLLNKNSMLVKTCKVFPLEFIMRAYITGSTNTSLWTLYQSGEREIYGQHFPEGLIKNQKLDEPILTITTKASDHDYPITKSEILNQGILTPTQFETLENYSKILFQFGTDWANQQGLILVDTKYEFGIDDNNQICVIDELHTPDSSRYWLADDYETAFKISKQPHHFDKEKIRLWYKECCDPYQDTDLPQAPDSLIAEISENYINLYEKLTKTPFF